MYVGDYQKEFRRVLVNMREKCHLGETSVDTDDWTLFQNALKVIQICGELPHTYMYISPHGTNVVMRPANGIEQCLCACALSKLVHRRWHCCRRLAAEH